jgi:transcriptional regulator with XRE-family HTH domain
MPFARLLGSLHDMIRLDRRTELGDFLRRRRERLAPATVGLKAGRRRRTPGLTREEVAELAGISAAWYTWLEQGRRINPSLKVLGALAAALKLEPHERSHLIQLAQPLVYTQPSREEAPRVMQRMLEGYRWAAYITGRHWDVLAWNDAACELLIDFDQTPEEERNILRYMFLDPGMKCLIVDWNTHARHMVAQFRRNVAHYAEDRRLAELVTTLRSRSREFDTWWLDHDVNDRSSGTVVLRHPTAGELRLEYATFRPDDGPDVRLIMYAPIE